MTDEQRRKTSRLDLGDLGGVFEPRTSLLVYHRGGTEVVTLEDGEALVIGRSAPADVIIADPSLSREHARVELTKGEVWLTDLRSTNGSWLNGKRLRPAAAACVRVGEELKLGATIASVVTMAPAESELTALDSHDRFVERLEEELVRARTFGHSFAVLLVRATRHAQNHLSHWYPRVRKQLRLVDRAALYGPDALTVCLPESSAERARRLAQAIVEARQKGEAPLRVGVSVFPTGGTSVQALLESVRTACQGASGREPVQEVGEQVAPGGGLVVASEAMSELLDTARRVADTIVPVLIWGETGTGKEVVARVIHEASSRRGGPMRCLNCGAIPEQLVESTLFGHERGAFTGAERRVAGVFEDAAGGTVLLDEIGELPLAAQTVLLRVIEARRVARVGSSEEIPVDVRVIAATNRDLDSMVKRGEFRADLLYRLNAITLKIPALRERREDIAPLAEHFVRQAAEANGRRVRELDPLALDLLHRYAWPGNVRELRNVMERAVVLAQDELITVDDLSERVRRSGRSSVEVALPSLGPGVADGDEASWSIKDKLRRYEARLIVEALKSHGWNQTKTAEALGVSRRSLVEKIRIYGIKKRG